METLLQKIRFPYRDDISFGITVLTAVVVPLSFFMYTYEKFETAKLFFWLLLFGWGCAAFSKRLWGGGAKAALRVAPLPFLLLFLAVALSVLSATFGWSVLGGWFGFYPRFASSAAVFTLWAGSIVLLLQNLNSEKLDFLLKVLVGCGVAGAIVGIFQSFGIGFYGGLTTDVFLRGPGLLGNPNFSAMFIAGVFPLTFLFLVRSQSLAGKLYYAFGLLVCTAAVLLFSSRGAWLGFGVEALLLLAGLAVFKFPKRSVLAAAAVCAAGLLLGSLAAQLVRPGVLGQTFQLEETNVGLRLYIWDVARLAIQENPFFGTGPGNFHLAFQQFRSTHLASQNGVYDDAHNLFLQLGASTGLPFLLLFVVLISVCLLYGLRGARKGDFRALALLVSLVGFCAMSLFTPVSSGNWFLLAVLVAGLCLAEAWQISVPTFPAVLASGSLGIIAALAGVLFFSSEVFFFRGYEKYFRGEFQESLRLVSAARRLNPFSSLPLLYAAGNKAKLGSPDGEIQEDINRLISMNPGDARAYFWAANLRFIQYNDSGNRAHLNQAIEYITLSLSRDPLYAKRIMFAALYLFANNNIADSHSLIKASLSLDEKNIPGWLLLARIYQIQENREAMLGALERVSDMYPENSYLMALALQAKLSLKGAPLYIPVAVTEGPLE